jgi:hypothetical protein
MALNTTQQKGNQHNSTQNQITQPNNTELWTPSIMKRSVLHQHNDIQY